MRLYIQICTAAARNGATRASAWFGGTYRSARSYGIYSSHGSAHICATASCIWTSRHFQARRIAKSSQQGSGPEAHPGAGPVSAGVPGIAARPGRREDSRRGEGSQGKAPSPPSPPPPPPPGHRLRGAPREPPPAAADGRWQQTAGNGRAPRRGGGGTGSRCGGGCPPCIPLDIIFFNKRAGEDARRGTQSGVALTIPPPRTQPPRGA